MLGSSNSANRVSTGFPPKVFNSPPVSNLWNIKQYIYSGVPNQVITPAPINQNTTTNLYINGNIFGSNFIVASDRNLKDNILDISNELSDNIMKLKPAQFTFKTDKNKQLHYGFIAQEVEEYFPDLVIKKPDNNHEILTVNYLEIIPLLVSQIQKIQKELDELKLQIQK